MISTSANKSTKDIDDVIIFNSLEKRHIDQITKLEIDKLLKRVSGKKYNFTERKTDIP